MLAEDKNNHSRITAIFAADIMRRRIFIYIMLVTVLTSASVGAALAQIRTIMSKAMPLYERDTVTICVMGDMMMHAAQIENAHRNDGQYDFSSYFSLIEDRIARADIALANMEYTLSGEPYEGYPTFSAPDSYASYLAECGFDIFLAANNHIFDKGSEGAARTLGKYRDLHKSHGIRYCGLASDLEDRAATYPLTTNIKGINIALINFTYGTNLGSDRHWPKVNYMNDKTALKEALTNSRKADFTLVLPHWGNEYERMPSREQRAQAEFMKRHGVDIIIGSHPHVVQPAEVDSLGRVTIFSLGNFVSNQRTRYRDGGLVATIDVEVVDSLLQEEVFYSKKNISYKLEPVWVHLPEYSVMPREVGDTMQMTADSRRRYERFMGDVREHLGI